jgi:hypothetical protein
MQLQLKPSTSVVQLRCAACRHVFDGELPVMVPVSVAVQAMLALRCTSCGGKEIQLGQNRSASEDDECRNVPAAAPLDAEWTLRLSELSGRSKAWTSLIDAWPAIIAVFEEEAGSDLANWPRPRTASLLESTLGADQTARCH